MDQERIARAIFALRGGEPPDAKRQRFGWRRLGQLLVQLAQLRDLAREPERLPEVIETAVEIIDLLVKLTPTTRDDELFAAVSKWLIDDHFQGLLVKLIREFWLPAPLDLMERLTVDARIEGFRLSPQKADLLKMLFEAVLAVLTTAVDRGEKLGLPAPPPRLLTSDETDEELN